MKTCFTSQTGIEFILFPINNLRISYMVTNWCVYLNGLLFRNLNLIKVNFPPSSRAKVYTWLRK